MNENMTVTEKVAYLKGLMEGMKLDTTTNEGKVLAAVVDILADLADDLEEVASDLFDLGEDVDAISDDLSDVEDYLCDEYDDEYDEDDEYEDEDEDEIVYAADMGSTLVGSADEVLDSGFVIDEDSPEDIMDVFGDMTDAEDEE